MDDHEKRELMKSLAGLAMLAETLVEQSYTSLEALTDDLVARYGSLVLHEPATPGVAFLFDEQYRAIGATPNFGQHWKENLRRILELDKRPRTASAVAC